MVIIITAISVRNCAFLSHSCALGHSCTTFTFHSTIHLSLFFGVLSWHGACGDSAQANCAIMFGFGGSYDFLYHSFVKAGGGSSLLLCVLFYAALNMCPPRTRGP